MTREYKSVLDKIIKSCKTKDKWNNVDRRFLKEFRETLGTPTQVAQALGISVATLHWWEKQEPAGSGLRPPPSERQLKKFFFLVTQKEVDSLVQPQARNEIRDRFYGVQMRIRSFSEVMERANLCSRFWSLRFGRPYAIASGPKMFDYFITFLKGNSTHFYFVYRAPSDSHEAESGSYQAKDSCESLLLRLNNYPDSRHLLKRVHAIPIKNVEDALKLGLVDSWASYAMAEYSPEGYAQFQRNVDVWMEFVFDTSTDPHVEQKQVVWLELPAEEARKWRENRLEILKGAYK